MAQNRLGLQHGALLLTSAALTGCIYNATGNVMSGYASENLVPYMMASDDVGMACHTGESLGSFLMSFERVGATPDRAALVSLVGAAMCAEAQAWEAELHRLRAAREGRAADAQDALSEEKRLHYVAAVRFYGAYLKLNGIAGHVPAGACPTLAANDELFYLLGLSAGVLAVLHDKAADGAAGVPTDIPASVLRSSSCLPDDRWWGVPSALRAAIWVAAPPLKPAGEDPWTSLTQSVARGEATHVRLASAFQVQAAVSAGRADDARKAIAAFAAALQSAPSDPKWKLLDAYAASIVLHESDKLWIEDTGHRTPFGQLGTFQVKTPAAGPADADPFKE
jgi:hypothetical protein